MRVDRSSWGALGLAAFVLLADVLTKQAIVAWVAYGAQHPWLPILNVVHLLNPGAAFSFLSQAGGWQRWFFLAIALIASSFLLVMILRPQTRPLERAAFGLILGGALGNAADRLLRGAVVDWIDVHWGAYHWPAFNAADVGISAGVAVLVLDAWRSLRRKADADLI